MVFVSIIVNNRLLFIQSFILYEFTMSISHPYRYKYICVEDNVFLNYLDFTISMYIFVKPNSKTICMNFLMRFVHFGLYWSRLVNHFNVTMMNSILHVAKVIKVTTLEFINGNFVLFYLLISCQNCWLSYLKIMKLKLCFHP